MFEQFSAPQLIERGYAGTYPEVWRQWLASKGAPSITTPGMEMRWLGDLGFTGALQDRWRGYFLSLGLTGVLTDDARSWAVPEGGVNPPGDNPIPDPMWDDVEFFWNGNLPDFAAVKGGAATVRVRGGVELIESGPFNGNSVEFTPETSASQNGIRFTTDFDFDLVGGMTIDTWGKTVDLGPTNFPTWLSLYHPEVPGAPDATMMYFGSSDSRGFTTGGTFGYHHVKDGEGIPHDQWTHLAYTFLGDQIKIFSQGKLLYTGRISASVPARLVHITEVSMGCRESHQDFFYPFKGKLDELRITKGIRWTGDFTPPQGPVLVPTAPVEP